MSSRNWLHLLTRTWGLLWCQSAVQDHFFPQTWSRQFELCCRGCRAAFFFPPRFLVPIWSDVLFFRHAVCFLSESRRTVYVWQNDCSWPVCMHSWFLWSTYAFSSQLKIRIVLPSSVTLAVYTHRLWTRGWIRFQWVRDIFVSVWRSWFTLPRIPVATRSESTIDPRDHFEVTVWLFVPSPSRKSDYPILEVCVWLQHGHLHAFNLTQEWIAHLKIEMRFGFVTK